MSAFKGKNTSDILQEGAMAPVALPLATSLGTSLEDGDIATRYSISSVSEGRMQGRAAARYRALRWTLFSASAPSTAKKNHNSP